MRGKIVYGVIVIVWSLFVFNIIYSPSSYREIDYVLSYGNIGFHMTDAAMFLFNFAPVIGFHVLWGTDISRNYGGIGVYIFSRTRKRMRWYGYEMINMLISAFLLSMVEPIVAYGSAFIHGANDYSFVRVAFVLTRVLMITLFLFSSTVMINILSILFSDSAAYSVIEMVNLLFVAAWFVVGEYYYKGQPTQSDNLIWIHTNPLAHLMLCLHSFDVAVEFPAMNLYGIGIRVSESLAILLISALVTAMVGYLVIRKRNILGTGNEVSL